MGEFVMELWAFMKERKKFWLLQIIGTTPPRYPDGLDSGICGGAVVGSR